VPYYFKPKRDDYSNEYDQALDIYREMVPDTVSLFTAVKADDSFDTLGHQAPHSGLRQEQHRSKNEAANSIECFTSGFVEPSLKPEHFEPLPVRQTKCKKPAKQ
jgi:hypothetical protein